METEDIFIDGNLFDDTDQKDIKKISEDVLQDTSLDQNEVLFVDLPEEWPEKVKIIPSKITPNASLERAGNKLKKNIEGKDKRKGD